MFDSKEIAQKALLRADEIRAMRKRRKKRLGIVVVLICICVTGIVATLLIAYSGAADRGTVIIGEPGVPLAYTNKETGIEPVFPKIVSITIPADETSIEPYLINPEQNECLLSFEIILAGTGETLCKTGFIEPSMYAGIQSFSRGIPKGEHAATIIIRAYSRDTYSEIGTQQDEFVIVAK